MNTRNKKFKTLPNKTKRRFGTIQIRQINKNEAFVTIKPTDRSQGELGVGEVTREVEKATNRSLLVSSFEDYMKKNKIFW